MRSAVVCNRTAGNSDGITGRVICIGRITSFNGVKLTAMNACYKALDFQIAEFKFLFHK
jgi:hypothetical protein